MKVKIYVVSILLPVVIGAIIGFITSGAIGYSNLVKPILSPPGYLFPIVWTILYILMGISYGRLKELELNDSKVKKIYYLQLLVNALWSIFFFVFEWRLFSFIWVILLIILVIIMSYRFYNKNKVAGLLQIPYLFWLLFAAYLNLAIYFLN